MNYIRSNLRPFLWYILVAEVLGSIYGYYWYKEQLSITPWYLWLFTWDCPFYATLFSFWLFSYLKNYRLHRSALFTAITFTGLIKYGLWTVVIVQDSYLLGSPVTLDRLGLQISHFIMLIQGFLLINTVRVRHIIIVWAWMLLNDFMDYFVGTYPWMREEQLHTAMWLALSFTALLTGWSFYLRFQSILHRKWQ